MHRDEVPVEDIRQDAVRAQSYLHGMSRADFLADNKTKAAVVRELEIMGEAASRVSETFRAVHAEVPWKRLIGLRNFYIHVYDAVNYSKVWATTAQLLPVVEAATAAILPSGEHTE